MKIASGLVVALLLLSSMPACTKKRPRYGYDSQRWIPREHKHIDMRAFTGYPRPKGKRPLQR